MTGLVWWSIESISELEVSCSPSAVAAGGRGARLAILVVVVVVVVVVM